MINYYKPPGAAAVHSMDQMLQHFNLNINNMGIYHVGAHTGFDAYIYHGLGAKYIIWLECNPNLAKKAYGILEEWQQAGYTQDRWFNVAATNKDDEMLDFFFYNTEEDGTSSLLEPGGIIEKIPGTKFLGSQLKVPTITLDTLIEREQLPYVDCNLLNVDTQGTELLVFKGAQKLLTSPTLKYIICEVSFESLYKDGALTTDIDAYLYQYGFRRTFFRPDCIATHGDAIYIKE